MTQTKSSNVKTLVITAFFAAVSFVGIQAFRIPMPAAVGTPFLHFGHIFVMLTVLLAGPKISTVSGVLGLVIFDLLNGYAHSIPSVFVTTIIKCLLVGFIFLALKKRAEGNLRREYIFAVICAAIYGITNIILDFAWSTAELIIAGSTPAAALAAELTSIPATIINAVFTVAGIAILYLPVRSAYRRAIRIS